MPTYQYACTSCDEQLEVVQGFHDDPLTVCPNCGERLRKVYGSVGVVFKGSGFYRNDSRTEGKGSASKTATAGEGAAAKSDSPAKESTSATSSSSSSESSGSSGTSSPPASGSTSGSASKAATP